MNTLSRAAAVLAIALGSSGCTITLSEAKSAMNTTLDAAQVACIVLSHVTDAEAVMKACEIAADLRPAVQGLMGERAGIRARILEEEVAAGRVLPANTMGSTPCK